MKKIDQIQISSFLKYFSLSFLVLLLLAISITFVIEQRARKAAFQDLKKSELETVQLEQDLLQRELKSTVADLLFLRNAYTQELQNPLAYPEIISDWEEFSTQRKIYDQIRFIDTVGDEIIRINFSGTYGLAAQPADLQNKKDRYYFSETIILSENQIFISPLDYNIEHGEIETPYKPVIRFSIPVFNDQHERTGIIVLNYLAKSTLNIFREVSNENFGEIMLLNAEGYWLSSENEDNDFNFMFPDRENISFQDTYPNEWNSIISINGQSVTPNGLFTFTKFDPNEEIIVKQQNPNPDQIQTNDRHWYIVSQILRTEENKSLFIDNPYQLLLDVINRNIITIAITTILSATIAVLISYNLQTFKTIKHYSEYDGLTNVLNRRAGIAKINKLLSANTPKEQYLSLCFIDINGLKQVNDVLGHKSGDNLLITTVQIIKSAIRENDFIVRMGGDEFLIVFNFATESQAEEIWMRITRLINDFNKTKQKPYIISASHGVFLMNNNNKMHIDDAIKLADEIMYVEKQKIKQNLNHFIVDQS